MKDAATSSPEGEKLWHYMSLEKFLWLLRDKRPYLSRLTKLQEEDKKEGMLPAWLQELVDRVLKLKGEPSRNIRCAANDEAQRSYVFCWNKDECESSLMWAAYGDHSQGVCLQTTQSKIFNSHTRVTSGPKHPMTLHPFPVDYVDHNDHSAVEEIYKRIKPPYSLAQFKSREFKDENELRMVAILESNEFGGKPAELMDGIHLRLNEGGKNVPQFYTLLDKIVAGPKMDKITFAFLASLIKREFPVPFKNSALRTHE